MFNIEKVDSFPEIARAGRTSEELQSIVNALKSCSDNGERYCISGITKGNAYNSMQQRIRTQAKKMGLKLTIRFDADAEKLYFKAHPMHDDSPVIEIEATPKRKASVKSSDVKGMGAVVQEKTESI